MEPLPRVVGKAGKVTSAVPPMMISDELPAPADKPEKARFTVKVPPLRFSLLMVPELLVPPPMAMFRKRAVPPLWLKVPVLEVVAVAEKQRPIWKMALAPAFMVSAPVPLRLNSPIEPVFAPRMKALLLLARASSAPSLRL